MIGPGPASAGVMRESVAVMAGVNEETVVGPDGGRGRLAVVVVAAIATVAVLIGNGLVLMMGPWLVDIVYAVPGVPDDSFGFTDLQRRALAVEGLEAVRPFGENADLAGSVLTDGSPAFTMSEIVHMEDVRVVIRGFTFAWLAGIIALVSLLLLTRKRFPGALLAGLRAGSWASLAGVAVVGIAMLVAFDSAFTTFHGIFFEGDTWLFPSVYTLPRLYPDEFWAVAGGLIVGLVILQALAILLLSRRR